jgi:uncharacterized small protein (DUF1192 family)
MGLDMDGDWSRPRPAQEPAKLEGLSLEELEEHLSFLEDEIDRCRAMIRTKEGARNSAEAVFRTPT